MNLSELKPPAGAHKKGRRIGRGPGSGRGKTSGKGHKGQMARSGAKRRAWSEGGQMRIYRRLPKRGFYNPAHVHYQVVNLSDLAEANVPERVDIDGLHQLRLVRTRTNPVKILGTGTLDRALHVVAHAFSKSAEEKIKAAGGTCERLAPVAAEAAAPAKASTDAPANTASEDSSQS
jgi:large subunit ribosomal protein L15